MKLQALRSAVSVLSLLAIGFLGALFAPTVVLASETDPPGLELPSAEAEVEPGEESPPGGSEGEVHTMGGETEAFSPQGRYIVVLKGSVDHPAALAEGQLEAHDGQLGFIYRNALKGYSATSLGKADVRALRQSPKVKYVVPDTKVEALAQTTPTGVKRIFANENTALDIDEVDDVRVNADVAVIDTGSTTPTPT